MMLETKAQTEIDRLQSKDIFGLYPVATEGAEVKFDAARHYGSFAAPITSAITDSNTRARVGIVQKVYHQAASLTVPGTWVKVGAGTYAANEVNLIYVEFETTGRKIYWIV